MSSANFNMFRSVVVALTLISGHLASQAQYHSSSSEYGNAIATSIFKIHATSKIYPSSEIRTSTTPNTEISPYEILSEDHFDANESRHENHHAIIVNATATSVSGIHQNSTVYTNFEIYPTSEIHAITTPNSEINPYDMLEEHYGANESKHNNHHDKIGNATATPVSELDQTSEIYTNFEIYPTSEIHAITPNTEISPSDMVSEDHYGADESKHKNHHEIIGSATATPVSHTYHTSEIYSNFEIYPTSEIRVNSTPNPEVNDYDSTTHSTVRGPKEKNHLVIAGWILYALILCFLAFIIVDERLRTPALV